MAIGARYSALGNSITDNTDIVDCRICAFARNFTIDFATDAQK